jgi:hypothetical protein
MFFAAKLRHSFCLFLTILRSLAALYMSLLALNRTWTGTGTLPRLKGGQILKQGIN